MGIIGWITLGWQIVKLIIEIITYLRSLKKKNPAFELSKVVKQVNDELKIKNDTLKNRLQKIRDDLERECNSVGCPTGIKK